MFGLFSKKSFFSGIARGYTSVARAHAAQHIDTVLNKAISQRVVGESSPLVLFFDLNSFQSGVDNLHYTFPSNFVHTMAIKANPTLSIMRLADKLGLGFESASLGELTQSIRATTNIARIVFDSPVKSRRELEYALSNGVNINADNFQELDRLCDIVKENKKLQELYTTIGRLGLRINAQVGVGSIKALSTGQLTSKFGIGLEDDGVREKIKNYFQKFSFLRMLHVHSGSQGMDLQILGQGIRKVIDLAKAIGTQQIDTVDIGGGLPVNFKSHEISPTFDDYALILRQTAPELFDNTFKTVFTEFGRTLFAKSGWLASFVEYTKNNGGRQIVLQHAGADIAIRTVYHPDVWPLRVTIHDPSGQKRSNENQVEQDIAGPCCIAGDIIAHQRKLPLAHPGDFVVIHDVGGYYHSSYSRYNCRQAPPVVGYSVVNDNITFEVLQKGESIEESLEMFSKR